MKFRKTKAWATIRCIYWILVFSLAAFYYWFGFIKDFA